MFDELEKINNRPAPFQFYTADELWTDEHTSGEMLNYHLNGEIDVSSRNTGFIERSVEWIVNNLGVGKGTCVADFGCGPGLYTTRFAEKQAHVTGIDFSGRSIAYAKDKAAQKGLSIDYVNQNYLDYEPEKSFDLITMIMCDFCALSPAQRRAMLDKFHRALKPGGAVLLDAYSLNFFNKKEETASYALNLLNGFWSADKYYGFLNTFKYSDEKVLLDKFTIIEEARTRIVCNWLQCFDQAALRKELEESGFRVEGFYSDVAGTPFSPDATELAVVAKK